MAYFWVNEAQEYLQGLGFGSELPGANNRVQPVRINQWGADNSFFTDKKDEIRFGKGGVDDAEDAEVIVHEYGHAVHHAQVPASAPHWRPADRRGLRRRPRRRGRRTRGRQLRLADARPTPHASPTGTRSPTAAPRTACAASTATRYTGTGSGEVHADGEIWSRALFDIRTALGARTADRIIVNAQFGFAPDTSFKDAALTTIATAERMYGTNAAGTVRKAFTAREIPGLPNATPTRGPSPRTPATDTPDTAPDSPGARAKTPPPPRPADSPPETTTAAAVAGRRPPGHRRPSGTRSEHKSRGGPELRHASSPTGGASSARPEQRTPNPTPQVRILPPLPPSSDHGDPAPLPAIPGGRTAATAARGRPAQPCSSRAQPRRARFETAR